MIKKLMQLVLMIMLVMGMSVASQAATITVGSASGDVGAQVSIPITIDSTAGRLDCSFSVSFDNTKLEYAGKTSGDMEASLLVASTADINAAGKVQPIVTFEEGGATSGTIVSFKFNIKTGATAGATLLTIGDIAPTGTYTGVSGSVTINTVVCIGPTITVGDDTACYAEDLVEIPVTIDDTAGRLDCSFSVSFDNTKLQYTGKTSGDMEASLLVASTADINAAGKVQPIVTFEDGGATSGTIVTFKFTVLADLTESLALTIGDLSPSGTYCGEDGAVACEIPSTCTVTIEPQTLEIYEGALHTFTSTTTGTCPPVVWSVVSTIGSTITQTGLYHAGETDADVTDTVTVTAGTASASAVVTVKNRVIGACDVAISPAEPGTVECTNEIVFTATSTGTACETPIVYEWSIITTIESTITDGLYKAGMNDQDPCRSVTDIVRVTDTTNGATDSVTVTVNPCCGPICLDLTTVEPAESAQGQTLVVVLTAPEDAFKNIPKDEITVDFGEGITVNKIKDKSNNTLKVEITIDANAAIVGTRTVLVTTTPVVCYEGTFGVTLAPTIVILPLSGRAGEKIENVTITGQRTHFVQGKTKVKFGKNIDVSDKTVVDENTITLKIKIGKKAVVGSRVVTVTTNLGNDTKEVVTGSFVVLPAPAE